MSVHPGRERGRAPPLHTCHARGSYCAEAEEGLPILETALVARKLKPVFFSHEVCPVSAAQGIHEAGFLCSPACAFIRRDRMELLLEPAPLDA